MYRGSEHVSTKGQLSPSCGIEDDVDAGLKRVDPG